MRDDAVGGGVAAERGRGEVLRVPAFALFWGATTLRGFGGSVSAVAIQVLIITVLRASPLQISVLTALGVLPYLFLGLVVGAWMDRWRLQRTLVITTVARAVALASIPVLLLLGALGFWSLALVLLVEGVLTLFVQSAEQPLLPRLVPRRSLVVANARLGQADTVAGTAGPALGGLLLQLVGAPIVLVADALINLTAAALQSRIVVAGPPPSPRAPGRHVGHGVLDGLRYTYRHRMLRPLALSVHIWFLGNSIVSTVFAVFVLREVGLPAWAFGVVLTAGGAGGFLGAVLAPGLGDRLGAGRAILLGRVLAALPWLPLAVLPLAAAGVPGAVLALAAAQLVFGLAMGIEDANDTGYRQAVAPDAIQGRMNATIRTVNRVVFFFGALLTGALATAFGFRMAFGIGAIVFAAAATVVLASPLRTARADDR